MVPISVQLYTLREASAQDFDLVLSTLAKIGYKGVEPFNLFGKSPRDFRRHVEDLGMQVSSTHFPWVNRSDNVNQVVEVIQELGLSRAPGGYGPNDFADAEALKKTIDATQQWVDTLKSHGLDFFLHNHWWEFDEIDGEIGYHTLQAEVADVQFEIDTYWAANFGQCDPAAEIGRVRNRAPLAHIKDGPLIRDKPHVAVGEGAMDIPAIFDAVDPDVFEWAVVELDACETDMMSAVAKSYQFLTTNNLVGGNV